MTEKSTRSGPAVPPGPVAVVRFVTTGQLIMLSTMTGSMVSRLKSGCQEPLVPLVPLVVRASRQMEPPAVTWPVYIMHLHDMGSAVRLWHDSWQLGHTQQSTWLDRASSAVCGRCTRHPLTEQCISLFKT